jgi:CubicO group peptidase (beta-lactamase class C family)
MLTKITLPVSTPEAQGIPSGAIVAFTDAVEQAQLELHSLMLVRHGQKVAEGWWSPYAAELPHVLFSLSKSFTSTAVGLVVAAGLLRVDDQVLSFFPDDVPAEVNEHLAAMRVYDLLTMTTGHATDSTGALRLEPEGNWVKAFLAHPVDYAPGTHFVYNSGATYMLSAIVQKLTGQTLLDYLTPRLFEPLGIEGATWESCPRGINVGGWGLKIKTDEIARFGQLYLQLGYWQGQQLVPRQWVADATRAQVPNDGMGNPDWEQGYGYQFWRCRHNAYRGDGAFGQYCIVMPEQDAVLAITSGLDNMQAVLDLVWEHLLPAMQAEPLPADAGAHAVLTERLASLTLCPPSGAAISPLAAQVSGQTYHFDSNEPGITTIQLDFEEDGARVTLHDEQGTHEFIAGYERWEPGQTHFHGNPRQQTLERVAASGAWIAEDSYAMRLSFNETPFIPTLTFRFVEQRLEFDFRYNVNFGPLEWPRLVGKLNQPA